MTAAGERAWMPMTVMALAITPKVVNTIGSPSAYSVGAALERLERVLNEFWANTNSLRQLGGYSHLSYSREQLEIAI
jgi:hypothetical protein